MKMGAGATVPVQIPGGLTEGRLLEIYYYLQLTRSLEERLVNLYRQSKVIGGLYRSLGQEGESVGSAYALEFGDILSPLIRNLGSMLVKGAKPVEVLRQYMAKANSPTAGREMNIHFNDLDLGYLGQISHLGDMVPVMAGIALSFKMRSEPRVGLVYVGDGATSTGAFHEGMNFAAVQKVPLVIIVEHNGYAYSTPTSKQTAVARLADKGRAYGVPSETVDGNHVLAVYATTKNAVDRARNGGGPTLIEAVTYRRKGHAEHDSQSYQSPDEIREWESRDPVERYVDLLQMSGWATPADITEIDARVANELDQAVAEAEEASTPAGATALGGVYADRTVDGGPLWFRSLDG